MYDTNEKNGLKTTLNFKFEVLKSDQFGTEKLRLEWFAL
jgi:hypothetical protein